MEEQKSLADLTLERERLNEGMTEDRVPTHEREECGYCGRTEGEGHGPDCLDRRATEYERLVRE